MSRRTTGSSPSASPSVPILIFRQKANRVGLGSAPSSTRRHGPTERRSFKRKGERPRACRRTRERSLLPQASPTRPFFPVQTSADHNKLSWFGVCGLSRPLLCPRHLFEHDSVHFFDGIRIQHASKIEQHRRLLLQRQGSAPSYLEAICLFEIATPEPSSPSASFSSSRSVRAYSAHVGVLPGPKQQKLHPVVHRFFMDLARDLPCHLTALKFVQV